MSEWSTEHAWKSDLFTRAGASQNLPTHVRSSSSRYNEVLRDAPVSDDVHRALCDTVLTQRRKALRATSIETYVRVRLTVLVLLHAVVLCMALRSASLRDRRHWN